ncbi:hypothetical protein M5K25_025132 [Dendrobium thyrsiflorum]|uniref:Cystinosin n=1 Tax=Dendrobium thyrsiflorum TaxID=117978 RepID=A0ABD0U8E2_DENTH
MELHNTPFTVQLGRGASIQLANVVINTGNSEATIRFVSLEFPAATAMASVVPVHGITVLGHTVRPDSAKTYARRAYSVQQPRAARTATSKVVQQNRTSVFERLSHPEVSTVKKTDIKQKTLPILSSVITLPNEPFVPGSHDHEAYLSRGRLSRRQRRKLNARLRAQQPLLVHPSTLPALEPEANIPTQNKFTNLKWVKWNSSTGELKQSLWEQQQQTPAPQKKKYETLSARVHRVLKVARENGLMKKKYQRPFINKTAKIPQRELPAARVTQEKLKSTQRGEHWSMKPELRIQESADKRSRWKGKEIWRPRLPERKLLEKNVRISVTSGIASQRSASKKNCQQWIPKENAPITNAYNSRHLGESSKESYCQPTSSYQKEINVDRTPPIEEVPVPHAEPEIYWKRRSEIRVQENDEEEDTMEVEVVYMVGHGDEPHQTRGYKRRNKPGPTSSKTTTSQEDQIQYEQLEEEEVPSGDEQNDDQEEEVLAETLAQAQRRLKFQMKEKDKDISELNSKMIEMMAQITAMMQLMQKNIITNPAPVQPADHQSSIPTNLPTNHVPQVSGIRITHEEENEADQLVHLQTHQNVVNTSDPVMTPQLESIINEKIKVVIASEQVITSALILPINEEDKITEKMMPEKDEWQTVISKKIIKMIKQLKGVPGIKWKSSTEPVIELQENPNSGASTSRSSTWRRSKTKRFYKSFSKKPNNPNKRSKLKEKRTVLQKIINNLEDYRQPMRRPIMLADFMSELQIDPSEVEDDEQEDDELLHVETCRVISVASTVCQRDSVKDHDMCQIAISPTKMTDKMTFESCLMMERAKLNEDSEHTTKTSSDEAESNEVDQVQLRSGFRNNKLVECLTRFPQLVSSENQPKNGGTKLFLSLAQMIPVAANDVAFSIHAVLVTCFISFQILIYERGNQKVSKICIVVSSAAWAIVLVCLIISWPKHSWLWLISVANTIQVAITAIKYIPQAFMNFSSKSTIGWSIGFVLLDLSGGLLNFAQMAMQSIDQGTMINFYGNLRKTLLSLVVVFFDLLFIIQHYVLYPMAKNETNQILIEEAVAPLIDSLEKSLENA